MGRVRFFGVPAQGAVYFSGQPSDGDYVTIGSKTYEFDDNAAVTAGRVAVTIGGSTALTAAALLAAINANKPTVPVTASADPVSNVTVRIKADSRGAAGNIALVKSGANITVSAATLLNGENAGTQTVVRGEYAVTALDVLATSVVIETGLTSPRFVQLYTKKADGTFFETSTGVISVSGSQIRHDFTGATDLEAGDTLVWEAWE